MKLIIPFKKLTKESVGEAGGKGASLGEMITNGFLVPDGFVIAASAFKTFLQKNNLDFEIKRVLENVKQKDVRSVERASKLICGVIKKFNMSKELENQILDNFQKLKSKFVAVRSSATAEDSKADSWAGELESFLDTTRDMLVINVKNCWVSLFTPRAIFYRLERGLGNKEVAVAVVVQKMVKSEVSGVAFSVHPISKDKNQMVIEAGLGLGEAVVAGKITPDTYVIDKSDNMILDINISEQRKMIVRDTSKSKRAVKEISVPRVRAGKQKLDGKKIMELAEIIKKNENHYGAPMDIEWALEKGKLYVVQARPITTLE